MCKDDSWFIRHVEPPNACRLSDNLGRYQTRPVLVAKDTTTTGWQIACCTAEFRLCQPGRLRPQGVIHRSKCHEHFSSAFRGSRPPRGPWGEGSPLSRSSEVRLPYRTR